MTNLNRLVVALALTASTSACAMSMHSPNISDLKMHPGRYQDRTVSVNGVVTSSWGVPLLPFRMYKIDDGTGEVTIVSQRGTRLPANGEHVRVKGKVQDVAVLGGRALGLHIQEQDVYVKR